MMVETSCGILCNSGQKSIDKEKQYIFDADYDGRDGGDNGDDDGRHLEGADQVFAVSASVMEHLVLPRGCLLIALLMPMVMLVMMMVQTWNLSKILHTQIFRLKVLHRKSA